MLQAFGPRLACDATRDSGGLTRGLPPACSRPSPQMHHLSARQPGPWSRVPISCGSLQGPAARSPPVMTPRPAVISRAGAFGRRTATSHESPRRASIRNARRRSGGSVRYQSGTSHVFSHTRACLGIVLVQAYFGSARGPPRRPTAVARHVRRPAPRISVGFHRPATTKARRLPTAMSIGRWRERPGDVRCDDAVGALSKGL